jgi:hypothetical protein
MVKGQRACGRFEKCTQKFSGKIYERANLKDLTVDGRAMLKLI